MSDTKTPLSRALLSAAVLGAVLAGTAPLSAHAQVSTQSWELRYRIPTLMGDDWSTARLEMTPGSLVFSAVGLNETSEVREVTLRNVGRAELELKGFSVEAPFSIVQNTCSYLLRPGASCTLSLQAQPTGMGAVSGRLSVRTNVYGGATTLSILGLFSDFYVTPTQLELGSVQVGETLTSTALTLVNAGNVPLEPLQWSVPSAFAVNASACEGELAPASSCSYTVSFSPTEAGTRNAVLSVQANGITRSVALNAQAQLPAWTLSANSLGFGALEVGETSAAQTVVVQNTGIGPLRVTSVNTTGAFSATTNCPASLSPAQSCLVSVSYSPSAATSQSGVLTLQSNAGTRTVALSGEGLAAQLSLSPASLAFGSVQVGTTSATQQATIANPGNSTLRNLSLSATGAFSLSSTTCASTLAAGQSCTASLAFAPSTTGAAAGQLNVNSSAGAAAVSLSGTGVNPSSSVSTSTLSFADTDVNTTSAAQVVTLTNNGVVALNVSAPTVPAHFSVSNNCPASLAAGASCNYTVTFTPTSAGLKSETLVLNNNGGNKSVTLSGRATQLVWGTANELGTISLSAPSGTTFLSVVFASYGTPGGTGPNFTLGSCHASTSASVTSNAFVGRTSGSVTASNTVFGDPCRNTPKRMYITLRAG